jgi:hypothetical protein
MEKNIKLILVIALIIGAIFLFKGNELESFNIFYENSQLECETQRQNLLDEGRVCVIDCLKITSSIESCIEQYGYTDFSDNIGDWIIISSSSNKMDWTCREYYEEDIKARDPKDYGMYQCIPIFKQIIGKINILECTPSNACATNTCIGSTCTDLCGNNYQGTKYCNSINGTVCAMDVKECSDGSYVSRIPPDCEFEQCPTDEGISPIIFWIIGGIIFLIIIVKKLK